MGLLRGVEIKIQDLRVDYGDFTAVDGLSLEIERGSVYGLVGPNGAGKTTTIRVLATLLAPTYGHVEVGGLDIDTQPQAVRKVIGYMPDLAPIVGDLTVWEWLDHNARSYGLTDKTARVQRIEEVLGRVDMAREAGVYCKGLSRGMTQRVVLAKTLLHQPQVLILDEPASGMDPMARLELSDLLKELGRGGTTVLISSHILSELSEMCTHVAFIERGRLRKAGRMGQVMDEIAGERRTLRVEALVVQPEDVDWVRLQPGVVAAETEALTLAIAHEGTVAQRAALLQGMVERGMGVHRFEIERAGLSDLLREMNR